MEGNSGDVVNLSGGGWTDAGLSNGANGLPGEAYRLYTNSLSGSLSLYVDTNITVQ